MILHILLGQSTTNLNQTIPSSPSLQSILPQFPRGDGNFLGAEIIEHDDICTGGDGLSRFGERLTFYVYSERESCDGFRGEYGLSDTSCVVKMRQWMSIGGMVKRLTFRPDVIVF